MVLKKKRELSRIQGRLAEIAAIDFFNASGREAVDRILTECDALLRETKENATPAAQQLKNMCGRTWVTRKGIYVDCIACAWLAANV
ncbi:MAG: hypothetical protein U9R57_14500 [Thermodesulfobacteriota bacterium]|nr:hypothetical protein [Thermodesulfobacteriota bacterium]